MDWNICVVSDCVGGAGAANLNNALLYGSKVLWIPPSHSSNMLALVAGMSELTRLDNDVIPRIEALESFDESLPILKGYADQYDIGITRHLVRAVEYIREINARVINSDFKIEIPREFVMGDVDFALSGTETDLSFEERYDSPCGPIAKTLREFDAVVESSHATIIHDFGYIIEPPQRWQTHQAAQTLMNAMSKVLLPDISRLSFDDVKGLQERAIDELEPMRAEMLRLTQDLRNMLGESWKTEDLAREAENLIATKVEPAVRELNSRIKTDIKETGSSYLAQGLKFITLCGVGWLFRKQEYSEKALIDGANFIADKIPDLPTLKASTPSSRFVVEIQKGVSEA